MPMPQPGVMPSARRSLDVRVVVAEGGGGELEADMVH